MLRLGLIKVDKLARFFVSASARERGGGRQSDGGDCASPLGVAGRGRTGGPEEKTVELRRGDDEFSAAGVSIFL